MAGFDALSPDAVIMAVEAAYGKKFQPVVTPYPSYVNRVYGLSDLDEEPYVAKFYRPDRWTAEAIGDEHRFMAELASEEFPVVPPIGDAEDDTLAEVDVETEGGETTYRFALFPRRAGRLFDAEDEESWIRIGALCGRLHAIGSRSAAPHRLVWTPDAITAAQVEEILTLDIIPADMAGDFRLLTDQALSLITDLFSGVPLIRLHGDLHRGNILDRGDEGLLLIDLDDMSNGPAIQDLWLLMPGRAGEVGRETGLMAEGYENFRPFPWEQLKLMEPLRLMRMIHFVAWCARQRMDRDFHAHFPDWGSRGWWIRELEDLRDQLSVIRDGRD